MKQIIMSLGVIVFAGAMVAAGTGAFFNDTETSTGNTFRAGAIDLTIDSEQHYNGNVCENVGTDEDPVYEWVGQAEYPVPGTTCTGTWPMTDLTVERFFDFEDLKPGDYGENTISIHIDNNDAYLCAALANVGEADNGQNEPEALDDPNGDSGAELDDALQFFAWVDEGTIPGFGDDEPTEGDNVFQDGETVLGTASAAELANQTWALAEGGDAPIPAGTTGYIGLAWCVGEFGPSGECSGASVNNASQGDEWFTDIMFYVEQSRNNAEFSCETWRPSQGGGTGGDGNLGAVDPFLNGFEVDLTDWTDYPGPLARVASGTDGVPSASGDYFATVTDGAFTHWGNYASEFPVGGYTTEVKVYLDMAEADGSDKRVDFSSAINDQTGTHLRDFIFSFGTNPGVPNQWGASVSNNAPGWPLNPARSPIDITETGWYTLQSYFHDVAGILVVTMNILDADGVVVGTWDLTDPGDDIATTVGGNRYGWFISSDIPALPFDDSKLYLGGPM